MYDDLGRVTSQTTPEAGQWFYQYNALNQVTQRTDARGVITTYGYNTLNRPSTVSYNVGGTGVPNPGTITYTYGTDPLVNEKGRLKSVTDGSGSETYSYDALGRITQMQKVITGTTYTVGYGYNLAGELTSLTYPSGRVVTQTYDAAGRLSSITSGGTQANNAIGRLITEWDGTAGSSDKNDYTYDTLGRVLTANRTAASTVYTMAYTYDLAGNLTSISYPSSGGTRRKVDYLYNANAELNIVRDTTGTAFDYVTATTYSNLGPMQQLDLGNGVRTTLGWNKNGEMTSLLTQKVVGASYLQLTYAHNANGQIQQIVNNLVTNQTQDEKYTYDELHRLLTAQRGTDASPQRKYSYDYDRYGNRWAQAVVAGSGLGRTDSYSSSTNRVTSANFSYDNSGNATATGSGTSFGYNAESFITSASTTLGSGSYGRDAAGRRVRKTVGGTVTDYFYVGSELVAEKTGAVWTDYVFFGGLRVAQVVKDGSNPAVTTYLHTDHLGSVRRCTDASGAQNGACDYEPFGEVQPSTSCSVPTNVRFAGMYYDAETALYHTWFRAYEPSQARWLGVDALAGSPGDPQTLNRYPYALDDPINLTDPTGLSVEFIGGRPVNCSVEGLHIPCAEFVSFGYLEKLLRDAFEVTGTVRVPNCANPYEEDCGWSVLNVRANSVVFGFLIRLWALLTGQQPSGTNRCAGPALVIKGNIRHIGRVGAFRRRVIQSDSAIVAPEQFGKTSGADMRSFSDQISGTVQYLHQGRVRTFAFNRVRDVIGHTPDAAAHRANLIRTNPGLFLIELPGLPHTNFQGEGNIVLNVPNGVTCPQNTQPR